ncbi:hypothetical protein NQ315_005495 [Exocentrus adspersus]|uniref:Phosphatidylethanolamine-binding protein n=1 Tax=Exocentrus adspersus TaxID=1586481 RepID=A0AAV8VSV8_9CUCU|nr:hypothetical protein NQ315_005495 [Exocentrus adspersus]
MKAFKDNAVTPDVISAVPDKILDVEYLDSGKKVNLGNELAPKEVKEIPHVGYDADPDSFYTLIMTDPDAPSRKNPVRREWNHWLVVNIPGPAISEGETITEYVGSAPPKGSGLHRYVFVLFQQPGKLTFDEPQHSKTDGKRGNFSTEKLRKKYNLGKPVAGNFFQAQFDDSVFKTHEIVPDVVSVPPAKKLVVKYTKSGKEVNLGEELPPKFVTEAPDVQYEAEPNSFYSLIFTDPDAPSRKNPIRREWHHWLVVNIPGDKVSEGEVLTEYVGSGPPEGSELHRYTFLLYKQPKKLSFDEARHSNTDPARGNFSTEKFAKKYNLGNPVAGNFYLAQFDESVPLLRKQLGFN